MYLVVGIIVVVVSVVIYVLWKWFQAPQAPQPEPFDSIWVATKDARGGDMPLHLIFGRYSADTKAVSDIAINDMVDVQQETYDVLEVTPEKMRIRSKLNQAEYDFSKQPSGQWKWGSDPGILYTKYTGTLPFEVQIRAGTVKIETDDAKSFKTTNSWNNSVVTV